LNDDEILEAVSRQLNHTAKNMGYRALTASVREETGENVSSVKVMEAVRELDPEGVARRQKHLRPSHHFGSSLSQERGKGAPGANLPAALLAECNNIPVPKTVSSGTKRKATCTSTAVEVSKKQRTSSSTGVPAPVEDLIGQVGSDKKFH
jgi:hypothetical protein